MKDYPIIDSHSHLGDIFAYEKNVIYKKGVSIDPEKHNPFDAFSDAGFVGPMMDHTKPEQIQNMIDMTAEVSFANTLEKFVSDMEYAGVDYACMLPIPPFIWFEDYLAASKICSKIIPFTAVDWTNPEDEQLKKQLIDDFRRGAKGLKIHPILQSISLKDPRVEDLLNTWAYTELPVISHCGVNSYYPDDLKHLEVPENGDVKDFIWLAKKMPHVKFIGAHCGGLVGGEMELLAKELGGADNLWVDTSFRSPKEIKEMIELFGEDRVLFGVDRPFAKSSSSLEAVLEAVGDNDALAKKILYTNTAKLLKLLD
ncbi:amidohydrolase family protein [Vagococcus sp. DIV0080]|uniref:Amidohydrolase family protein n=1 Tax=Candidatus Vagococcus giribetii TaxID=2230876 RepID=A0ABS3HQY5_9ENTE|nr:amidohydrolase family protein [Vagococcus sp. DIV0080]MBO0475745.1 amidohydrolase family protein [Vagococcus sp. DIV0080]